MRKPYSKNMVTPVFSDEDADLRLLPWRAQGGYACRCIKDYVSAHRIIAERVIGRKLNAGECIDHINHNKLDNRRENLRLTNNKGNCQNRNCGDMRGAYWNKQWRKWVAIVRHDFKNHFCGYYLAEEDAAAAAKQKRIELGFLSESFVSLRDYQPTI